MRMDRVWAPPAGRRTRPTVALAVFGLVAASAVAGCGSPATEPGAATVTASRSDYRAVTAAPSRVVPVTLSTDPAAAAVPTSAAAPAALAASDGVATESASDTASSVGAGSPSASDDPAPPPGSLVAAAPVCAPRDLGGALRHTEGTPGNVYNDLVLRNRGTAACRLAGYPDVQFVDAKGVVLGAPAQDTDDGGVTAVLLPAGGTASAMLRITQAGIQRGCTAASQARRATALRVTPPGGGAATVSVPLSGGIMACASSSVRQLLVGPLASP